MKKRPDYMNRPTLSRPLDAPAAARQSSPPRATLSLCVSAALLLLASGCAEVKPWDRGILADYIMIPGRDPVGDMQKEHVYYSREEATGGHAVGGSGCGCN